MSSGLEGRSRNPIALLVDTLLRPQADVGGSDRSSVTWEHRPEKAVPHVVIGTGKPGGAWHCMEPTLQTLSLGSWLDLPMYSFEEWRKTNCSGSLAAFEVEKEAESVGGDMGRSRRPLVGEVARYYSDYIHKLGLARNFLTFTRVEKVENMEKVLANPDPNDGISSCSSFCSSPQSLCSPNSPTYNCSPCPFSKCMLSQVELEHLADICSVWADSDDCGIHCPDKPQKRKCCREYCSWYLKGSQKPPSWSGDRKTSVCVFAKKLVLASGTSNHVRWLKVPGEDANFVTHDLPMFIKAVDLCCDSDSDGSYQPPAVVMVVGAGLSAADAILHAFGKGLKVIHVFCKDPHDPKLVFNGIPKLEYPEYSRVFDLMKSKSSSDLYICHPKSQIVEFKKDRRSVTIVDKDGRIGSSTKIAKCGIFIGSDANLNYLPESMTSSLGLKKAVPIGSRNPVNVDVIHFASEAIPSLYAVGSLTGDSFVRFGIGSALGAAQHILGLNSIQ